MGMNETVAGLPGVHRAVRQRAEAIASTARSLAAGHGGLGADISVEDHGYDVDVVLSHEAALSIEYGHMDRVFGSGWVPGLSIMRDAARLTT